MNLRVMLPWLSVSCCGFLAYFKKTTVSLLIVRNATVMCFNMTAGLCDFHQLYLFRSPQESRGDKMYTTELLFDSHEKKKNETLLAQTRINEMIENEYLIEYKWT